MAQSNGAGRFDKRSYSGGFKDRNGISNERQQAHADNQSQAGNTHIGARGRTQ